MSDYKRNPRGARRARKSMGRKAIVVLSLMMVLVLAAVGGTVAWLTATTGPVNNTFTVGDINITLTETTGASYHIVPGQDLDKNPKVTVTAGSEKCYVFVKVDEANWPTPVLDNGTRKVNYTVDSAWEAVPGVSGVWCQIVDVSTSATDRDLPVLANNKVYVSGELTKTEVGNITTDPTLTFTAYACQYLGENGTAFTPEQAWQKVAPTT